ncbi:hypothetical protein BDN71DRAFT_764800 [Pleurotus eryngii]|uniref:Uncharacterized protein n=1 Tax=Pleurotus eryngii TaxID=5323 RepID=A0A9P5ZYJ0_PLEER|nr:hypothetical protein BDN71DRAFT_764800 [Pleurotus eryngii]
MALFFIIEGAVTVLKACLGFFILPDFPNSPTRWLNPSSLALAERRMHEEVNTIATSMSSPRKVGHLAGFVMALTDRKIWWITSIMTLGLWIVATMIALAVTWHSDTVHERCWHSVAPVATAMPGFIIAMSPMSTAARYVTLFLMAVAPVSGMCIMAWALSPIRPANKRAAEIALINALSQLALVAGPYAWDRSWGPSYA